MSHAPVVKRTKKSSEASMAATPATAEQKEMVSNALQAAGINIPLDGASITVTTTSSNSSGVAEKKPVKAKTKKAVSTDAPAPVATDASAAAPVAAAPTEKKTRAKKTVVEAPAPVDPATAAEDAKISKTSVQGVDRVIEYMFTAFNATEEQKKTVLKGLFARKYIAHSSKFSKSKKHPKIEGHPNKPLTSYIIFVNERRAGLLQREPTIGFKDVTKRLSVEWNNLTQAEKQKYTDLAAQDKVRYEEALKKFYVEHPEAMPVKKTPVDHSSDPAYIQNPATGNWVKRNSKVGKGLVTASAPATPSA